MRRLPEVERIAATLSLDGSLWLESSFCKKSDGGAMLFANPLEILTLTELAELEPFLRSLEERRKQGFYLAGWLGYEAGYGFEPTLAGAFSPDEKHQPLAWFGVYRAPERLSASAVAQLFDENVDATIGAVSFSMSEEEYAEKIDLIKKQIAAGNVYQVNLTGRYRFSLNSSAQALFAALRGTQPSSYTAFLTCGRRTILSFSPELFFTKCGSVIKTMPMKGTVRRGKSGDEDRSLKRELAQCPKNRAENLMIVDLLRNDLGKICRSGSVETDNLFAVETWPTLHQMVSTIRGELRDDVGLYELFRAIYPCGSITGAPKISAMKQIRHLEPEPRGIYTGAIGFITPDNNMTFSVAIRTIELVGQAGVYGSGSGIVWDSNPHDEYRECQLKSKILDACRPAFDLFESMLWNGSYLWLDEHLERLASSAAALGFPCEITIAQALLQQLESELRQSSNRVKVKLSLSFQGDFAISSEPIVVHQSGELLRLCIAAQAVDSSQPLLYHKTTARELFNRSYALAQAEGYDEVIFLNERGEVTEGAISTVLIRKGGKFFTPPPHCGLLHGIFRRYVLATRPFVAEKVLTLQDLCEADMIFIANAVRGMRAAVLCDASLRAEP